SSLSFSAKEPRSRARSSSLRADSSSFSRTARRRLWSFASSSRRSFSCQISSFLERGVSCCFTFGKIAESPVMSTLPIKKVVLYKHGVGYFERHGTVEGDVSLDLYFRAQEMNDVLK